MDIVTADSVIVKEGDKVFSHYTCTWGTIQNPQDWGGDIWFDFIDEAGKIDLLNGDRICKEKPRWMNG